MEIRLIGDSRSGKSTKGNSAVNLKDIYKRSSVYDGIFIASIASTTTT
jgi:hypothetical protein